MTKQTALLLQPERRADETRENYVGRRQAAKSYVASSLMGTLFWNTELQGAYFNDERKNRPAGKSAHRAAKKIARIARERGLHLSLDSGSGENQTAVEVIETPSA